MAINIDQVGGAGVHSFSRVNVNVDDDYIYFNETRAETIPATLNTGVGYLYASGVGSIGGFTSGDLVFAKRLGTTRVQFTSDAAGNSTNDLILAGTTAGTISFNIPVVYDQKLNIDSSTSTNQAVKY